MDDRESNTNDGLSLSNGSSSSGGSTNSYIFEAYGSSVSSDDSNMTSKGFSISSPKPDEKNTSPPSHADEEIEARKRTVVHTNIPNEGRGHIDQGLSDSGPFETIPGDSFKSADEENEASKRTIVNINIQNEERGHIDQGFSDSGPFETIPGDILNSVEGEIEVTNHEDKGHINLGFADSGLYEAFRGDSLDSTKCKSPWRDSKPWPQITCSLSVVDTENRTEATFGNTDGDLIPITDIELFENSRRNSSYPTENVTEPTNGRNMQINNDNRRRDSLFLTENRTEATFGNTDGNLIPITEIELFENSRRNSSYPTENVTELTNGRNMHINNDNRRRDSLFFRNKNKNCFLRGLIFMLIVFCISGAMLWIINNEYFLGSKDLPNIIVDPPIFPDKCENGMSTVTVGELICIPSPQKFTSNPSRVDVLQVYSQYLSAPHDFSFNISSDAFEAKHGSWTIKYNSSKTEEQLLFMIEKATCHINGIYEIRAEYEGNVSSSKFEIKLKDPPLQQNVTRLKDSIYVHCKMIKTCVASSLALFRNDGGSSRMIPDINVCSYNDKESGTTVTVEAIIPASWFSGNQTISCVPLMTDPELAANLTSTTRIPVCEGDCVPDCTDDPQGGAYFPDKNDCTKFFQCSNGKLVSQSCSPSTYWSTTECTCVHFDDAICNIDNNRFLNPLLSIEKCTKASLV